MNTSKILFAAIAVMAMTTIPAMAANFDVQLLNKGAAGARVFEPSLVKVAVGDTVTFTLGTLTLGTVTATGVISPIQLAAGNAIKLTNLLVLFQSLDADGNPNNGINITAPTAAAVTGAIRPGPR